MTDILDLGPHTPFILWAYGIAVLVIGALIAWIAIDQRRQRRLLAALEAQGLTRRSSRKEAKRNPTRK